MTTAATMPMASFLILRLLLIELGLLIELPLLIILALLLILTLLGLAVLLLRLTLCRFGLCRSCLRYLGAAVRAKLGSVWYLCSAI